MNHAFTDAKLSEGIATARSQWPVQVGPLRKLEADETDLTAYTTISQRFEMMWQLAKDAWAMRGEPIDESPFSRHPGRFVRRGS